MEIPGTNLVEFKNVNELPQVPKGHRRELLVLGDLWFYEDIRELWDNIYS